MSIVDCNLPTLPQPMLGPSGERIDARLQLRVGHLNVQVNPDSLLHVGTYPIRGAITSHLPQ
jgi:hypothetical protein